MDDEPDDEYVDGTRKPHGLLWYIFCGPGALLMKIRYYSPTSYREDAANFRRMGKPIWEFYHSITVYLVLAMGIFFIFAALRNGAQQ